MDNCNCWIITLLSMLCITSCRHHVSSNKALLAPGVSKKQKADSLNTKEHARLFQPDSLEKAFNEGKWFPKSIIRMSGNQFIQIDSENALLLKDPIIRKLYFKTGLLTPENREAFYKKIISALPKEYLHVHQFVHAIPEVKQQAMDSDGGRYTLFTQIVDTPTKEDLYYTIEISRDYYDANRFCTVIPIVKINMRTLRILVADPVTFEFYPIKTWRRMQQAQY